MTDTTYPPLAKILSLHRINEEVPIHMIISLLDILVTNNRSLS